QSPLCLRAKLLWLKNYDKFRERSGKAERHLALVFLEHRGSGVLAYVEGFIERKTNSNCLRNTALGDLLFIDQQGRGCSLSDATAVISKFDANDVIAGRKRLIRCDAIFMLRLVWHGIGKERFLVHQR